MKVLIIDDEPKARSVLKVLIEENCPKIEEIFMSEDLMSGVKIIKEIKPNIVFLDIEMPEHSGLEILDFVDKNEFNFEIVFTTAYNDYAIKAFELSAVDYLLKPVRPSHVKEAVERAEKSLGSSQIEIKLEELRNSLMVSNFDKIGLPFSHGIKFVSFKDIIVLEAEGMYTKISTTTESEILVSKPLKHFVELLSNVKTFYKPHRSFLINLSYIKEYIKKDGGYIVMDNDKSVSISKDKRDEFLSIVQNIG